MAIFIPLPSSLHPRRHRGGLLGPAVSTPRPPAPSGRGSHTSSQPGTRTKVREVLVKIDTDLVSAESGVEGEQTILFPSLQLLPGRERGERWSPREEANQIQPVNVVLLLVPAAKEENCRSNCFALLLLPRTFLKIVLNILPREVDSYLDEASEGSQSGARSNHYHRGLRRRK